MDGTVVSLDGDDNIISFVPKKNFNFRDIGIYYKTVNIYKFSKSFARSHYVPFLEAYSKALGNNEYYEQVLRVITLLEKPDIKALRLDGEAWYEIDDIQDLDNAETIFSNSEYKLKAYQTRYGGYWRYPELIDFCYLVNPFFPPEKLKKEIRANFDTLLTQYPSGQKVNCLLAAKYFSVSRENIVVGNGAAEIINAYCSNTSLVTGIVVPTFEEYKNRMDPSKLVCYCPSNPDFYYTVSDLIDFFSVNKVQQLILVNPDNPSGNFISKVDLISLLKWSKEENIRVIIDESFIDFTDEGPLNSLIDNHILDKYQNLIIIKSISKSYGVPGIRLGVAISGDMELIKGIKGRLAIWNLNSYAEFYMQIFGKYEGEYYKACELFKQTRQSFFLKLTSISYLRVVPSQANYFLCEVKGDARKLTDHLLTKYNLLIKDCTDKFGFDQKPYVRIAVRDESDNERMIVALKEVEGYQREFAITGAPLISHSDIP
jgi:histidinol-phosphate/aromatic aminotransferase/cobyric acid decarboxylase-like protein